MSRPSRPLRAVPSRKLIATTADERPALATGATSGGDACRVGSSWEGAVAIRARVMVAGCRGREDDGLVAVLARVLFHRTKSRPPTADRGRQLWSWATYAAQQLRSPGPVAGGATAP